MDPFKTMPSTPSKTFHVRHFSEAELSNFNEPPQTPTSSASDSGVEDLLQTVTENAASLTLDAPSDATITPYAGVTSASTTKKKGTGFGPYAWVLGCPSIKKSQLELKYAQRRYPPEACVLVGK